MPVFTEEEQELHDVFSQHFWGIGAAIQSCIEQPDRKFMLMDLAQTEQSVFVALGIPQQPPFRLLRSRIDFNDSTPPVTPVVEALVRAPRHIMKVVFFLEQILLALALVEASDEMEVDLTALADEIP